MIRNPLSYPGNKNKLLKEIIPELFECDSFVDVFSGSGVVGVNSYSKELILNDINLWAIKIIKTLYTESFEDLKFEIEKRIADYDLTYTRQHDKGYYREYKHEGLSRYNKTGYQNLKKHFNETHDIHDLIVLQIYGFNHYIRFNKKGMFNVPVGKVDFSNSIHDDLKLFMERIKQKEITFLNKDFRDETLYKNEKSFYYFDPPYLVTTAPYNGEWDEKTEIDLLNLIDRLSERGIKFALSNVFLSNGKENVILKEWSKKYTVITLKRQYRNANYQKVNVTDSIEVLIKNY